MLHGSPTGRGAHGRSSALALMLVGAALGGCGTGGSGGGSASTSTGASDAQVTSEPTSPASTAKAARRARRAAKLRRLARERRALRRREARRRAAERRLRAAERRRLEAERRRRAKPAASNCDPSYRGACLDPNASDYDCAGGSGNGPKYVQGPIDVVGPDHYGLDRDGDGIACE